MPRSIGRDEVQRLIDAGAQVLEVLEPDEYARQHLPGAVNVPLWKFGDGGLDTLDRDRPIVVYCYDNQ